MQLRAARRRQKQRQRTRDDVASKISLQQDIASESLDSDMGYFFFFVEMCFCNW